MTTALRNREFRCVMILEVKYYTNGLLLTPDIQHCNIKDHYLLVFVSLKFTWFISKLHTYSPLINEL